MALSSNLNRKVFTANAAQTAFTFGEVLYFDQNHLEFYVDGVKRTLGSQYTVSPTTNTPNGTPGGTITSLTPMVGGENIVVLRNVPLVQSIDYQENEKFPANTHEMGLDWLTMISQQFEEKFSRSIMLPRFSLKSGIEFPDLIAANASRGISIRADLTGLETFDRSATPYSSVLTTKGDLATYAGGAQARLPVGQNGQVLITDSAQPTGLGWGTVIGDEGQNIIANPLMDISQRNPSAVSKDISSGCMTDRWSLEVQGGHFANFAQWAQANSAPSLAESGINIEKSLYVRCATAELVNINDVISIAQAVEVPTWRLVHARDFTISFWFKSSLTGTYSFYVRSVGLDRSYVTNFSVVNAGVWERKTITVPANPTTGTWNIGTGSMQFGAFSASVGIGLAVGSNYQTSAGAWQNGQFYGTAGQVNLFATPGNECYLTGVQVDLGSSASDLRPRIAEDELRRCQRHYQKSFDYNLAPGMWSMSGEHVWAALKAGAVTQNIPCSVRFPVQFASGNLSLVFRTPGFAGDQVRDTTAAANCTGLTLLTISDTGFMFSFTGNAATAIGNLMSVHWEASTGS